MTFYIARLEAVLNALLPAVHSEADDRWLMVHVFVGSAARVIIDVHIVL